MSDETELHNLIQVSQITPDYLADLSPSYLASLRSRVTDARNAAPSPRVLDNALLFIDREERRREHRS